MGEVPRVSVVGMILDSKPVETKVSLRLGNPSFERLGGCLSRAVTTVLFFKTDVLEERLSCGN